MAVTLDQVLAALDGVHSKLDLLAGAVATGNSKLDTLLPEMRLIMSLQDDLAAATATLQEETASLLDSQAKLAAVLDQMKAANVDPAIVAAFDDALGQHKSAVDNISLLANPAPPPAGG
jgi:hypothetical protein